MSNVRTLGSNNNLSNIPHMLRNLAAEFESGETPQPRTLILIGVRNGDYPPDIFQFGEEGNRSEQIGALFTSMRIISEVEQA